MLPPITAIKGLEPFILVTAVLRDTFLSSKQAHREKMMLSFLNPD